MLGRKDGELEYSRWVIRMNNEIFNFGQQTPARQPSRPYFYYRLSYPM